MLYEALVALLLYEVPEAPVVVQMVAVRHQGMQQVKVDVAGAEALKAGEELLFCALLVAGSVPGVELGGYGVAVPGVALRNGLSEGLLRAAVVVHEGSVEIGAAGCDEHVGHGLDLLHVYAAVLKLGKAHETEAEPEDLAVVVVFHDAAPLSDLCC